jgi:hypothetical protein
MMGSTKPVERLYTESMGEVSEGLLLSMSNTSLVKAEPILRMALKELQRETEIPLIHSDVFKHSKEWLIHIVPKRALPEATLMRFSTVIVNKARRIGFGNLDITVVAEE